MLRHEWTFQYTAAALAKAAAGQRDFRDNRVRIWESKKQEVITRIRETGLNIEESIADMMNNTSHGKYIGTQSNRDPTITIDMTMRRDLAECVEKIKKHTELRTAYDSWFQLLSAQSADRLLSLEQEDWVFFFGK